MQKLDPGVEAKQKRSGTSQKKGIAFAVFMLCPGVQCK
jgi:hypothetical protein